MRRFLIVPARQSSIPRNQARSTLVSEIRPCPLNQYDNPIAESDEKENVDEKPGQPGNEAGNMKFPKVSDGGGATDSGETAFVHVVKVLAGLPLQITLNVFRRSRSFLHGYRGDAGK